MGGGGIPAQAANFLGDTIALGLTAVGSSSQTLAYQIRTTVAEFTTVSSTNNSAKLPTPANSGTGLIIVKNDSPSFTLAL
ncbi:hypothetical protein, partial [Staphylococcus aureus]